MLVCACAAEGVQPAERSWSGIGLSAAAAVDGERNAEPHAWVVVRREATRDVREDWALVHLPPRTMPVGGVVAPARDGAVKLATVFQRPPVGLAAVGRRALAVFAPEAAGRGRTVLSLEALPAPFGDAWVFEIGTRLDVYPSLPGEGELAGVVGTVEGAAALVTVEGGARVLLLRREGWSDVEGPSLAHGESPRAIICIDGGIGVVTDGGAGWRLHTRRDGGWDARAIGGGASFDRVQFLGVRDRLIGLERTGDATIAVEVLPGGVLPIARLEASSEAVYSPMQTAAARLIVIDPAGGSRGSYRASEVSLESGRVLYDGAAHEGAPISPVEFRVFAVGLIAVSAIVLVAALRPDPIAAGIVLPAGFRLAPAWRRVIGGVVDVTVGHLVASGLGFDPGVIGLHGDAASIGSGVLVVLMFGCAISTGMECAAGRSLGKMATGCFLAPVGDSGMDRIRTRILVRGLIRWVGFPIAFIGLWSARGIHAGDRLSRIAVVVREPSR